MTPPKLGPKKIVSIIAIRIAMTLDVKIVWFGRHAAVCVQKWHKSAIFGCSWFQKFNFNCLLLKLLICSPSTEKHIQICVSFVDTVIYHDFGDLSIFLPFFNLESQIMALSQKFQKIDFLGHCSFKQFFHDV